MLIATNYKLDCRYKWLIFSIIGLFLIIWTPYERKQSLNIWNKLIKKLIVISVFCVGIFLEVIFWGEKTEGEITGMVTMIECFSIFPKSKER